MAAIETPITELTPVYTDPAVLQGKAVLVHDPTTGDGIVFDASKLDPSEKYQKPSTGIPKTDLAEVVQESLEKADTALQPEDIAQEKGTDEEKVMSQKAVTGIFTELQLKSGVAEGLADTLSAGTAQEITFRRSGGDGVNYVKRFKGKTLVWNAFGQNISKATGSWTRTYNPETHEIVCYNGTESTTSLWFSVPSKDRHKYLISFKIKCTVAGNYSFEYGYTPSIETIIAVTENYQQVTMFGVVGKYNYFSCTTALPVDATMTFKDIFFVDLTLMFGAGNEPSTVAEFEAMFPLPYYEYNEGTPISNDASALETGGFNQWDEEWESGGISSTDGANVVDSHKLRSKNLIPVVPNATYCLSYSSKYKSASTFFSAVYMYDAAGNFVQGYSGGGAAKTEQMFLFVIPANVSYIRFVVGDYADVLVLDKYFNDICVNLSDASKNGTYEPYWKRRINFNISTLKDKDGNLVFPYGGMNGTGTAFDMLKPDADGVIRVGTRAFGRVDLGTLTWTLSSASNTFYSNEIVNKAIGLTNIITPKHSVTGVSWDIMPDKSIRGNASNRNIWVHDSAYSDAAALKAAMQGVMLYYELATPVEFELAEPIPNAILVDELGTERAIFPTHEDGSPSAPLCTDSNYSISVKNLVAAIKNLNQA